MNQATNCNEEIVILPESDDHTLCVTLKGIISQPAYEDCIFNPIKDMAENGQYNLLVNYDESYKGWSEEAAKLSFQTIINYGPKARKLAYVNPPDSKLLQIKMARPLFGGEIRFFDINELDKALQWVKA
jgi:hypothetical protein